MSVISLVPWMAGEYPYLTLELELRVDGEVLPEPCNRASLRALIGSAREPGNHFIFTCSCGDAGCGGFFKGIDVADEGERVTWTDRDGTYSFEFEAQQYRAEVERTLELSRELLANVADERVVVDPWDVLLFPEWTETTQEVVHESGFYRRRRGSVGLSGEHAPVLWGLGQLLLMPWYMVREVRQLPGALWYMLKEQRKTEWRWLRQRIGRDRRD